MGSLASILRFLNEIRWELESLCSFSMAVKTTLASQSDDFSLEVCRLSQALESGNHFKMTHLPAEQQVALHLIRRGLTGESVLAPLKSFCEELEKKIIRQAHKKIKKMPTKSLMPIFLFQWPVLVFLFIYPLVKAFWQEIS